MWLFSILNIFRFPFNITLCLLPLKKSLTQFNNCPSKPYLFNFNKSLSCASFHKLGTQPSSNVLSKIFCNGIYTMSAVSRNKRGWHPSGPIDLLVFKFFNCLVKTSILVFKLVTGVVKYPGALLTNGEYSVLFPKLKVVSCRTCLLINCISRYWLVNWIFSRCLNDVYYFRSFDQNAPSITSIRNQIKMPENDFWYNDHIDACQHFSMIKYYDVLMGPACIAA